MNKYSIEPFVPCQELVEFDDCLDVDGFYSLDIELAKKWERETEQEKQEIIKYAKLLKRFNKNPNLLSYEHKKWIIENCTLETELIPKELMAEVEI